MAKSTPTPAADDKAVAAAPPAPRKRAEPKPAERIALLVVLVQGAAGVTTPTTVYEYELPVLEAIHGEENVFVHSEKDVDVPAGLTASQAHAQMLSKYPPKLHDDVKRVYPTARSLSRASGLVYNRGDNAVGRFNQALIRDHSVNRNSDASLTGADLNDPQANQGKGGDLEVSQEAKEAAEQQRLADLERRNQAGGDAADAEGDEDA